MSQPRFRDLLAVVARASDVGMGLPADHAVRTAIIAHGLAAAAALTLCSSPPSAGVEQLQWAGVHKGGVPPPRTTLPTYDRLRVLAPS